MGHLGLKHAADGYEPFCGTYYENNSGAFLIPMHRGSVISRGVLVSGILRHTQSDREEQREEALKTVIDSRCGSHPMVA